MITISMNEQSCKLTRLLEELPSHNSYRSISQFHQIFNQYLKILDSVNSYNEVYKSATRIFYSDIVDIRDHMQELLNADSHQDRERAFERAKSELTTDLCAL
jgi:hypothetical protein